jgi:hypothetical protein
MLYLNPNTTNTLTVTWTERSSTGDRYILRLTSIAKNTTTGSLETGSYRYEVYDTNSTVAAALAVVETGLAFIQTATIGFNTYANTITYNVYEASDEGVFDSTFDSTFA